MALLAIFHACEYLHVVSNGSMFDHCREGNGEWLQNPSVKIIWILSGMKNIGPQVVCGIYFHFDKKDKKD